MNKDGWIDKLKKEIVELQKIQHILLVKNPTYPFLYPVVENAIYSLANLLSFIEQKNPYFTAFSEDYFHNRQIAMHKAFFSDLHICIEEGLKKIATEKRFLVETHKQKQFCNIVEEIREKVKDASKIEIELQKIIALAPLQHSFNDYLNSVLEHIPSLSKEFIRESRNYFDGISICRNKISHPFNHFTDSERQRLKTAKLGAIIAPDGYGMQMTFEGYKNLIIDIIHFFDTLHAYL